MCHFTKTHGTCYFRCPGVIANDRKMSKPQNSAEGMELLNFMGLLYSRAVVEGAGPKEKDIVINAT